MDPVRNPYNPGAGTRPPALVGRESAIRDMDVTLQRLLRGTNSQSQLLTGLRGVGKTVLLNEFEELADGRGYFHEYIEVSEDGNLAPAIASALRRVLLSMDAKRRIGEAVRRALGVLKAFTLRIPDGPELSIDVEAVLGPADSGELGADLAGLFVEIGGVARDHGTGILLAIDELHYVDLPTFTALIVGLHRASQERLPITIAGAGLPTLAALTGEAKTYAERMFIFPRVDSLTVEQAVDALQQPALDEEVRWSDGALEAALAVTQCFPYFLQEFGRHAWDVADGPDEITDEEFARSVPLSIATLDDGFFRVGPALRRRSNAPTCEPWPSSAHGPVGTAEVAALLGRPVTTVSSIRDGLIKRALCYAPERGKIDFTVPVVRRVHEALDARAGVALLRFDRVPTRGHTRPLRFGFRGASYRMGRLRPAGSRGLARRGRRRQGRGSAGSGHRHRPLQPRRGRRTTSSRIGEARVALRTGSGRCGGDLPHRLSPRRVARRAAIGSEGTPSGVHPGDRGGVSECTLQAARRVPPGRCPPRHRGGARVCVPRAPPTSRPVRSKRSGLSRLGPPTS